jgi:hypothetical protein
LSGLKGKIDTQVFVVVWKIIRKKGIITTKWKNIFEFFGGGIKKNIEKIFTQKCF